MRYRFVIDMASLKARTSAERKRESVVANHSPDFTAVN